MRVVIAEDSTLLREGLTRLLEERAHDVVAAVGDAHHLVTAVDRHRPDVAIVDVRMPTTHTDEGIRAVVELRAHPPRQPVMVLSQYVEEHYVTDLLADDNAGIGYLLKDRVADVSEFVEAVERVAAGGTALDPEVVTQLLARRKKDTPLRSLTPREQDVLALMAEGRSNSGIGSALVLGESAVEKHVGNIFAKLGLGVAAGDHRRVLAVLTYLRAL